VKGKVGRSAKLYKRAQMCQSLSKLVELLKLKVLPNDVKENNTFATSNAIQVRIDENVRMLAELHAR
jgi:hypothetical protein